MLSGTTDQGGSVAHLFLNSLDLPIGLLVRTSQIMSSNNSLIPVGAVGMIVYRWPRGGRSQWAVTSFYDILLWGEIFTLDVDLFRPI